ncbi:MAG: hypothetical protein R3C15_14470 [Thermoleophilia bacterium]
MEPPIERAPACLPPLTRRRFLGVAAAGTGALLVGRLPGLALEDAAATPADLTLLLARADDQVRLTFELLNLELRNGTLRAIDRSAPSAIRVVFGSQHTAEEATPGAVPPAPTIPRAGALGHRSAGPSRVVFRVQPPLEVTLAELLDWARWELQLDPRARLRAASGAPGDDVTAIEAPQGLVLTPEASGRFIAGGAPVTTAGVTELWRARLGVVVGSEVLEPPAATPTVRAIHDPAGSDTFLRAIDDAARADLVEAMSDPGSTRYPENEASTVARLWLSLHGAFLDVEGAFDGTGNVAAWVEKAATGRDVEVRVSLRGYLAPFGHEAAVVTVTERQFVVDEAGFATAALVQRDYLSITRPTLTFPRPFQPLEGRKLPFREVTILQSGLVPVGKAQIVWDGGSRTIGVDRTWIVTDASAAGAGNLELEFEALDRRADAVPVTFTAPVAFVPSERAFTLDQNSPVQNLIDYYADSESNGLREIALGNQSLAWAEEAEAGGAKTVKVTDRIRLTLEPTDPSTTRAQLLDARQPAFYPAVERAWVRDDGIDAVRGAATGALEVVLAQAWLDHGNGSGNHANAYLQLARTLKLSFPDAPRSLAQPDMNVTTFSQDLGAGVDLPSAGTQWDPASALDSATTLLGNLALNTVIGAINAGANPGNNEALPRYEVVVDRPSLTEPPTAIRNRFTWNPPLKTAKDGGTDIFLVTPALGIPAPSRAEIFLEVVVPLDGGDATTEVDVRLRNFALQLPPVAPVIALVFDEIRFHDGPTGGRDVDVDFARFAFTGSLGWLGPLIDFLTNIGKGASVVIDDQRQLADVTLALPIPDLQFGVLNISNLVLGVEVILPFDGEPVTAGFTIGTRDDPVRVTVMGVGGSAWLIVEVGAGSVGFVRLELGLAVTFELAINVIVASASISASLGAALEIEANGGVTLTAYVECVGTIQALGIIGTSVEFLLALEYVIAQELLRGSMTVTVEVEALFARKEVSFDVEQTVELGDGVPGTIGAAAPAAVGSGEASLDSGTSLSFADRYSQSQWQTYCDAFA